MKVYIVRHGEVPHNALKQYNNQNEDLTEKGIKQAEELREKIKTIDYDILLCSPLTRAKHTADIINYPLFQEINHINYILINYQNTLLIYMFLLCDIVYLNKLLF